MKRQRFFHLSMAFLVCMALGAHAEGLTSQFGFSAWPATPQPGIHLSMGDTATQAPENALHTPSITPAASPQGPQMTPRPTLASNAQTPSIVDDYTTHYASAQEQNAYKLLSDDRSAHGLAPLALDAELCRLARMKSEDMRDLHYFAHESPTYGRVKNMLTAYGYPFTACGENIAHHATVEKCQIAFLSSPDHRRNVLSSAWQKVGIGIAYDQNGYVYLTQIFAR